MIVPRNGRFGVRVYLGGGKYEWLGMRDTEEEALLLEAEARVGRRQSGGKYTVAQWGDRWLKLHVAKKEASTRRTYHYAVQQIKRHLGDVKLEDVTRDMVRDLLEELPYTTIRVARTMWFAALHDEVIERNPWSNLRLPRPKGRKDITALTAEEIETLCQHARQAHRDYGSEMAAILTMLGYAIIRPAELCALKWSNLDFRKGEITVEASLDVDGREKPPKNGEPRRIVMPPQVVRALDGVQRYANSPYVFHSPRGKRLNKSNLYHIWGPVRVLWDAAGGRDIDLYELRHAGITMLIHAGVPLHAIALQAGHTDGGRLIQEVYGHPDEAISRDLVRVAFGAMESPVPDAPPREVRAS